MKAKQLAFYVLFSIFIIGITFAPEIYITNEVVLKNEELWRYGFGPACIALAIILLIASVASWKGSKFGSGICLWWGAIYSIAIGGIAIWHFPSSALFVVVVGIIWGVGWFFWTRSWLKQVSV